MSLLKQHRPATDLVVSVYNGVGIYVEGLPPHHVLMKIAVTKMQETTEEIVLNFGGFCSTVLSCLNVGPHLLAKLRLEQLFSRVEVSC